jgi:hypothetical protein
MPNSWPFTAGGAIFLDEVGEFPMEARRSPGASSPAPPATSAARSLPSRGSTPAGGHCRMFMTLPSHGLRQARARVTYAERWAAK